MGIYVDEGKILHSKPLLQDTLPVQIIQLLREFLLIFHISDRKSLGAEGVSNLSDVYLAESLTGSHRMCCGTACRLTDLGAEGHDPV